MYMYRTKYSSAMLYGLREKIHNNHSYIFIEIIVDVVVVDAGFSKVCQECQSRVKEL